MDSNIDDASPSGCSRVEDSVRCRDSREGSVRTCVEMVVRSERAFFCTAATLVSSSGCAAQYSMWNLSRGLRAQCHGQRGGGG